MNSIITKLRNLKIELCVVNSKIQINAPEGVVTEQILDEIKENKEFLISYINSVKYKNTFTTLNPAELKPYYKLSSSQKRLFFLYQFDQASVAYNLPQVIKIEGEIDKGRFNQAFHLLIKRHESLRTSFRIHDEEPVQFIADGLDFDIEEHPFKGESIEALIGQFIKPFDLGSAPLLRARLVSFSETNHLLLIDLHHIICDGISHGILVKDFILYYNNLVPSTLPLQYKDFAEWQQSEEQSAKIKKQSEFWLNEFLELPEAIDLPSDFQRPILKSSKGDIIRFELDEKQTARLNIIAEKEGVTLFMLLLSAFNVFLAKVCNKDDIVVGVPVAGRPHADTEDIIGMFVNSIPLRSFPKAQETLRHFLLQVKSKAINCFENQSYPYEELIDELKLVRDTSRNPLFDVMFIFQNFDTSVFDIPGLKLEQLKDIHILSKFDLSLEVYQTDKKLFLSFEYATDLFETTTIERFIKIFNLIVLAFTGDLNKQLGEIEIITEAQKDQILNEFNATCVPLSSNETIISLFERNVAATPHHTAIIFDGSSITYDALNKKVNQLAHYLLQVGVEENNVIATFMERSIDYVVSILAILKVNAIYLPIDINLPDSRISYMLADSDARYIITNTKDLDRNFTSSRAIILCTESCQEDIEKQPFDNLYLPKSKSNLINIIYTSGSTGNPKGVVGSQKGIMNRLGWGWSNFPFSDGEVCCQKTNLSFVDHVAELFAPLLKGVPQIIIKNDDLLNLKVFLNILIENKVTRLTLVPSLLQSLILIKKSRNVELSDLRYVFCSGETLSYELTEEYYREFKSSRLVNIYGSTEVTGDATFHVYENLPNDDIFKYFNKEEIGDENKLILSGITKPCVDIESLANNFRNTKINPAPVAVEEYFKYLHSDIIPYTINTSSKTFIGHMTSALPYYVYDISRIISELNQNLVKVETSKIMTFLERGALAMLHRSFYSFSESFYNEYVQKLNTNLGIVTSGGSTANLSAILAARNKALYKLDRSGFESGESIYHILQKSGYKDMVIMGSKLMHYSFKKVASALGLGEKNIVYVENNKYGSICPEDLEIKIDYCKREKLLVIAIVGIAGSTERGSIDPLMEIGELAKQNSIHFHVDAAWGGALIFSEQHKEKIKGIELADSITFCGHKQLYLPQGISVCLLKDPYHLNLSSITANYQAQPGSFDAGRYTIEGSRPALSLCLHATLKILGKKGIQLLINRGIEKAGAFVKLLSFIEGFQLLSCNINIVNYRYIPREYRAKARAGQLSLEENLIINEVNTVLQSRQFFKGETFVSKTSIQDERGWKIEILRVVLSNPLTTDEDLIRVLNDQLTIIEEIYREKNDFVVNDDSSLIINNIAAANKNLNVIGKPLDNTRILILDKQNNLMPIGIPGEICVSGDCLSQGYLNNPYPDGQAFVSNPHFNNSLMFKTGDVGKWLPDGSIAFFGRLDQQINLRGFRIEIGEIEFQLKKHSLIQKCAVMLKNAGTNKFLVAYYVSSEPVEPLKLRSFLSDKLPYYMLPSYFVHLEALPLTASGKLDRIALHRVEIEVQEDFISPTGLTENTLVQIWSDVLSMDKKDISINKSFFELGGNSLKIVQLNTIINEVMDWEISIPEMFRYPSIMSLLEFKNSKMDVQEKYVKDVQTEVSGMENVFNLFDSD